MLTADRAKAANLILVADRGHRTAVGQVAPATRRRTFTIRQAARLATWVVGDSGVLAIARRKAKGEDPALEPDDLRAAVPALPAVPTARLEWLVGELDAARGLAPVNEADDLADWGIDDIGDPHVVGWHLHDEAVASGLAASAAIVAALREVLAMP
jgi:hypothetical protein